MKKKNNTKASTSTKTNVIIRVQARDGMFLGPDSYGGAVITLKDFHTNKIIATGFTDNGDSGTRLCAYGHNVSPSPIVTPTTPIPTIYWLAASSSTVQYAPSIYLSKPTLLKISARVPLPAEQGDQFVSATQWVIPGRDLIVGAGFVLEIPGLWIQPEIISNQREVKIRAKVTMMCGCEINDNMPWLPSDFVVTATIKYIGKSKKLQDLTVPLAFDVNSQFYANVSVDETGEFEAQINAYQISTNNAGSAVKTFHIE